MEYWETEFVNKRKSPVDVQEDGRTLLTLQPGEAKFMESQSAFTSYAAWYKIVFKDDKVDLHENKAWSAERAWPGQLVLTILNSAGAPCENFYVGGVLQNCYQGIPKFIPVTFDDAEWNFVARMEIKMVEHTEHQGDYIIRKNVVEKVKTMRSKSEIKAIEKRLYDKAMMAVKLDLKRRFPNAEL